MAYRRTQVGYLSIAITGAAILWLVGAALRWGSTVLWISVAVFLLLGWAFSSLTIEVDDAELRHHFGPGIWRRRVPLADIAGAQIVPSRWWEGWGIRFTPRGMLYNVSGFGAVEIVRRSDARFRLGTDEPEVLRDVIRRAARSAAEASAERDGGTRDADA